MIKYLKVVKKAVNRFFEWKPKIHPVSNLIQLGSDYGGWVIPADLLTPESICYLAGAGEDISFDVEVAAKYKCKVFIFDPTPKAKTHFDNLVNAVKANEPMYVNGNKDNTYRLEKEDLCLLTFDEIGLWNQKGKIKFYSPSNPDFVSHSALNLSKSDTYFVADVERLSNLCARYGHTELDLLKIDIEGAEYNVIQSIIEDKLKIKVICIEFDEAANPLDKRYINRIKASLESLIGLGYRIVYKTSNHNYTLLLEETYLIMKSNIGFNKKSL